ncbi:MAG: MFS transporter, partial [Deltaproteobacteria bacterium]|nr:MFS transporter [Deltaproteobacteria bacterium]
KFAGIEIPPDLRRSHFFSLYLATFFIACVTVFASFIQPLFLKQVINIPEAQAGSINSGLQNVSQVITLLLVGLIGILSDKVGRRILPVIGFIIAGAFYVAFGYAKEISLALGIASVGGQVALIYLIKLIIGIGFILCYPQFITMVADYTFERDRGKGMALNGVMMSLGAFIIFGVLAQIAVKVDLLTLFYIIGGLAILGAFISRVGLVDRMPKEKPKKLGYKEIYRTVSKSLSLKVSYIVTFVARADVVIIGTLIFVWVVYVAEDFGIDPVRASTKGAIVMLVMTFATFFSFPVVGVLLDRIGRIPVLIATLIIGGTGYCLMAMTENPFSPVLYVFACMIGIGFAGAVTGANTLASDASPKPILGSVMGGLNTMQPIGVLIFLQLGGFLFDKVGPWGPFALKGIADVACGLWILSVRKRLVKKV